MANGFGTKPFNAPIVPDFSAGMPTVAPAGGAITPEAAPMSPIDTLKEVFFDIRDGIETLVMQSKEALGFEKEQDREQDVDQSLGRGDKDDVEPTDKKSILESLRENLIGPLTEGFQNVSIGEKLKAALLVGALALFVKVSDSLVPVVKKVVEAFQFVRDTIFGDTENPGQNTILALLGIFAAFKVAPLVTAATVAVANVSKAAISLGAKAFTAGKESLKFVFEGINKAGGLAVKGATKAFKIIEGGFKGTFDLLGKGFKSIGKNLKLLRLNVGAMTVGGAPLLLLAGIAAAIAAVIVSLKSAFDTFKQSLDEGDGLMTALGKAILDFVATLTTLPLTLVKKAVSYIAGLFGFSAVQEKLDSIDFKEMFIDIIKGFINKVKNFFTDVLKIDIGGIMRKIGDLGAMVGNTLKAIAKGSVAMIAAAAPGGESPTEAFARVYNEVMAAGEAAAADSVPVVKKDTVADEEIEKSSTTMEAAKSAVTQDAAYTTDNRVFNTTNNIMQEKIVAILKAQLDLAQLKMKMDIEAQKNMMMIIP